MAVRRVSVGAIFSSVIKSHRWDSCCLLVIIWKMIGLRRKLYPKPLFQIKIASIIKVKGCASIWHLLAILQSLEKLQFFSCLSIDKLIRKMRFTTK